MSMSRIKTLAIASFIAASLVTGAGMLSAQTAVPAGAAKHGQQLFMLNGCYECHNTLGQGTGSRAAGSGPGPNLAPAPIPFAGFLRQVRTPRGTMPPYDARLLSNQDVADIYAFLAAQPPARDPHTIALLNGVTTGSSPNTSRGAVVFAANCALCHGGSGQGGSGPSLKNEGAKKDGTAVAAFVKNPPGAGAMPKLFPGFLSDADVTAVAAYVESLK
jgi:ubiquinol-cytochrome c reductase cytochrome c subunit